MLSNLGAAPSQPTPLYCDNKLIIAMVENTVFHERTKLIELDCHLIREKVHEGIIRLMFINFGSQVANGFPKALAISQFKWFDSKLRLYNLYNPAYLGYQMRETKQQTPQASPQLPYTLILMNIIRSLLKQLEDILVFLSLPLLYINAQMIM